MFYDEILLFEDELADNGSSVLSVKIVSINFCLNSMGFRLQITGMCSISSYIKTVSTVVSSCCFS